MQVIRRIAASIVILVSSVFFWGDTRLFADSPSSSLGTSCVAFNQVVSNAVDQLQNVPAKSDYWSEIEAMYMQSLGYDNREQDQKSSQLMSERESMGYLFSLLKPKINELSDQEGSRWLEVLKDLRVLYGTEKNKSITLVSKIDRTYTLFGRTALIYKLAQPTTNPEILGNGQSLVRQLIANPTLCMEFENSLQQLQNVQKELLTLIFKGQVYSSDGLYMSITKPWVVDQETSLFKRPLYKAYNWIAAINNFVAQKVNTAAIPYMGTVPLESLIWWKKLVIFRILGVQLGVSGFVMAYFDHRSHLYKKDNYDIIAGSLKEALQVKLLSPNASIEEYFQTAIPAMDTVDIPRGEFNYPECLLDTLSSRYAETDEVLSRSWKHQGIVALKYSLDYMFNPRHPDRMHSWGAKLNKSDYTTLFGYYIQLTNLINIALSQLPGIYETWETSSGYVEGIETLRKHLLTVRVLGASRKKFNLLLHQYPDLDQYISSDTKRILSGNGSEKFELLLKLVESNVFQKELSMISLGSAQILVAYKIFEEVKTEFKDLFRAIGEIDLAVSLARLYQEHQVKNVHYSFANYSSSATAYAEFTNVWNPFINPDEAVANTITMGAPGEHQHMLLTGSNTGGKSTLLRAIGISALMAQTLGLVPAECAILTPFDQIIVLLNVSDDPSSKESTFAAEGSRAQDLLKRLELLPDNGRALIFIDELFKGTDHYKGLKWASAITRYIERSPKHKICFFATHFHELTRLEAITKGVYKNYSMDAVKNPDGSYICSYKLQQGPCAVNIADDIMRDRLNGFDLGNVDRDLDDLLLPA